MTTVAMSNKWLQKSFLQFLGLNNCQSKPVVLKLFAPAAHFATFPNFAAHLDQSADLFWFAPSFPRFPLPDALYCIS